MRHLSRARVGSVSPGHLEKHARVNWIPSCLDVAQQLDIRPDQTSQQNSCDFVCPLVSNQMAPTRSTRTSRPILTHRRHGAGWITLTGPCLERHLKLPRLRGRLFSLPRFMYPSQPIPRGIFFRVVCIYIVNHFFIGSGHDLA